MFLFLFKWVEENCCPLPFQRNLLKWHLTWWRQRSRSQGVEAVWKEKRVFPFSHYIIISRPLTMPPWQGAKGEVMDKLLTSIKLFKSLNTSTHIDIDMLRDKYCYSGGGSTGTPNPRGAKCVCLYTTQLPCQETFPRGINAPRDQELRMCLFHLSKNLDKPGHR